MTQEDTNLKFSLTKEDIEASLLGFEILRQIRNVSTLNATASDKVRDAEHRLGALKTQWDMAEAKKQKEQEDQKKAEGRKENKPKENAKTAKTKSK